MLKRRNRKPDVEPSLPCLVCGYNLRGISSSVCPECGELSGSLELNFGAARAGILREVGNFFVDEC